MAFSDRVKESGIVNASGNVLLMGAYTGYVTFSSIPSGSCYYVIESGSFWEVGYGPVYGGAIPFERYLTRNTILSSSQNNNKVNFSSGIYTIFHTTPAKHFDDLDLLSYMGMI